MSDEALPSGIHVAILTSGDADSSALEQMLGDLGVDWRVDRLPAASVEQPASDVPMAVFVIGTPEPMAAGSIRKGYPDTAIFIGIVQSNDVDVVSLFDAGIDLIIHDPFGVADIQRSIALAIDVHLDSAAALRERLRKMTAMQQLAIRTFDQTDQPDWLRRMLDSGRRLLRTNALAMWGRDTDRDTLRCLASSGLSDDYTRSVEGLIDAPAADEAGIERAVWMPVRDTNRLYGHLTFYYDSLATFSAHDLILSNGFASIVAAALDRYALQTEIHRSNRLYRELAEQSRDGVFVCRRDGTIEWTNQAAANLTGWKISEIRSRRLSDLCVGPSTLPWDEWLNLPTDASVHQIEVWINHRDHRRVLVNCEARRLELPASGQFGAMEDRIQIVFEDVTDQRRRVIELELLHDLTRVFSERGSIDDAFELVVERLSQRFGYQLTAVQMADFECSEMVTRATRMPLPLPATARYPLGTGICGRAMRENRSILVQNVDDDPDYISISPNIQSELVSVIRIGGLPVGVINIETSRNHPMDHADLRLVDTIARHLGLLLEQSSINERLERQAMTDPLTGYANRRRLMQALNELVSDKRVVPTALFLIEIDRFKQVNDRFGHLFGDEVLKQVFVRLEHTLRENDLIGRYGGDEIAVIFRNVTPDSACDIGERLRRAVAGAPFEFDGQVIRLSVSIGIALYPLHGSTIDELIAEADRAMYEAKHRGRNQVVGNFDGTRT
jgi:diguanylate cyclase (GGDEF)-like protein/PAS domain S-box-containing protein